MVVRKIKTDRRDARHLRDLLKDNRFPVVWIGVYSCMPVMFPPGRARLETMPDATSSPAARVTMGTVLVTLWTN
jgi:hypothetical protein